jgi:hypothetical protein
MIADVEPSVKRFTKVGRRTITVPEFLFLQTYRGRQVFRARENRVHL